MFELDNFHQAKMERYSKIISVPSLSSWFSGDEKIQKEIKLITDTLQILEHKPSDSPIEVIDEIVSIDSKIKETWQRVQDKSNETNRVENLIQALKNYHLHKENEYEETKLKNAKWKVENPGANVISRINLEAKDVINNRESSLTALFENVNGDVRKKVDAFRELYNLSKDVDEEQAKKIHFVATCSYYPTTNIGEAIGWKICGVDLAARLSEHYPTTFFEIFNAIMECIGKGSEIKKKPK